MFLSQNPREFCLLLLLLVYSCEFFTPASALQRGNTPPNECPGYDTKQSDSEAPVMLELWRMLSNTLLVSLPGSL